MLSESLVEHVLVDTERQVADKENWGRVVGLVTESVGTLLGVWWGAGSGVVDLDGTTINLLAVESDGGSGGLEGGELDVTETTGSVGVTIDHDTSGRDLTTLRELGSEPVVVDVPGELTNKDVEGGFLLTLGGGGGGSSRNNLGLLGWLLDLLLGLALA